MEIIEQQGDAILAYGYFTSDDIPSATLIANSTFKYNLETPTMSVKQSIILNGNNFDKIFQQWQTLRKSCEKSW